MKTQTIKTLADFCDASPLSSSLIRAVVRQSGGWESFQESAPNIARHGIDGGFHGFIYNADTEAFAKRNRGLIAELAKHEADEFGTTIARSFTDLTGQD